MTLLEILLKELPGKGGWPCSVGSVEQDYDGGIYDDSSGYRSGFTMSLAEDWLNGMVIREQYEAALVESKKVAWSGEGIPPVGCGCEIKRVADWMPVSIKYISGSYTIFKTIGGTEGCYETHSLQFRPIRSEEERKRDEAIKKLARVMAEPDTHNAKIVYQAIAAGDIPHVKIV